MQGVKARASSTNAPSGFHFGFALSAAASSSGGGASYTRPRSPSATIAISRAPIRPALPSALM